MGAPTAAAGPGMAAPGAGMPAAAAAGGVPGNAAGPPGMPPTASTGGVGGSAPGGVTMPPPPAPGGVPGTAAGGVGTPATTPVPGAPGVEAGGITTPLPAGTPGAPGTLAGGIGTPPTAEAGGTGPPTTGERGVRIEAADGGMPCDRSGGLVAMPWRMLRHGMPPGVTAGSAAAKVLNSGAVQKTPIAAIAAPAATRVVVRDIFPHLCLGMARNYSRVSRRSGRQHGRLSNRGQPVPLRLHRSARWPVCLLRPGAGPPVARPAHQPRPVPRTGRIPIARQCHRASPEGSPPRRPVRRRRPRRSAGRC